MYTKKFKTIAISLIAALSILGSFLKFPSISMAGNAGHVHEFGSTPAVERVIWEEVTNHFIYTGQDGKKYDYQTVTQYCLWYYSCYCGYRGNYYNQGRVIHRDVPV